MISRDKFKELLSGIEVDQTYITNLWDTLNEKVMDHLFKSLTTSASLLMLLCDGDPNKWIDCWLCDCECGDKPMLIKLSSGEELMLDSHDKLYDMITKE